MADTDKALRGMSQSTIDFLFEHFNAWSDVVEIKAGISKFAVCQHFCPVANYHIGHTKATRFDVALQAFSTGKNSDDYIWVGKCPSCARLWISR